MTAEQFERALADLIREAIRSCGPKGSLRKGRAMELIGRLEWAMFALKSSLRDALKEKEINRERNN